MTRRGPPGPPPGPGSGGKVDPEWLVQALERLEELPRAVKSSEPSGRAEPPRIVEQGRVEQSFPTQCPGSEALPALRSIEDLRALDGQRVRAVGTWEQYDPRKLPRGAPLYMGHCRLRLADEATAAVLVLPMWADEARRPMDEVALYEGRSVEIVGTAVLRAPSAPDGRASVVGPCLIEVEAILAD